MTGIDEELIREAANKFGSSTIVVSIETIRQPNGTHMAYTDCGRNETGLDAYEWALRAAELGAGELIITSVDREGTGKGYDLALTRRISEAVSIPVIACGGAGSIDDVRAVITEGKADAISIASCLHYDFLKTYDALGENYSGEGNTEFLKKQRGFGKINGFSLPGLKQHLYDSGVDCRWN